MAISFTVTTVPIVNMLGSTLCRKDWILHPRTILDYEIILPCQGQVDFLLDGKRYSLLPGDFLLIPPNQVHHGHTLEDNPGSFYYIHFSPSSETETVTDQILDDEIGRAIRDIAVEQEDRPFFMMPKSHFDRVFIPSFLSLGAHKDEVLTLCEKALHERNHLNISSKIMISHYVSQILIIVTRRLLEEKGGSLVISNKGEIPKMLQKAVFYIHEHIGRTMEVNELCRYLDVSPQYLIRLFQRHIHMYPVKYIQKLKMAKAKDLIRNTAMTIKEISYSVGYENSYYFSRVFRKHEGMSPTEYKQKLDIRSNA